MLKIAVPKTWHVISVDFPTLRAERMERQFYQTKKTKRISNKHHYQAFPVLYFLFKELQRKHT